MSNLNITTQYHHIVTLKMKLREGNSQQCSYDVDRIPKEDLRGMFSKQLDINL